MGKPHPIELRARVVAFVEDGNTHHAAAAPFRVSVNFVNDMVILKHQTGSLEPKTQGNGGWSKLGVGEKDYTVTFANTPAGEMVPVDVIFETKTTVGTWTFSDVDKWVGGAAPSLNVVGRHLIRFWVNNTQIDAEYVGMLA